jgi:hypothetical protein
MPDSIAKFEIIRCFYFWIKRHAGNQIKMKEKVAPTKVVLELQVITPIYETHCYHFDSSCDVQLDFEGEFNPMMMMIKGLVNLLRP